MYEYDEGFTKCPECNGTGETTTDDRRRIECVICEGSGQILKADDAAVAEFTDSNARSLQRAETMLAPFIDDGPYYAAVDAIANICLWSHAKGLNVSAILDSATAHYREESLYLTKEQP